MGFGASLSFIAIGAILAFALQVDLSGVDIHMVGWILILVGLASMLFTFVYTRPRRRASTAEIVEEEPVYIVHPDERAAPEPPSGDHPVPPHLHTDPAGHPDPAAPPTQPLRQATEQSPHAHTHRPQPGRHFEEGVTRTRHEPL